MQPSQSPTEELLSLLVSIISDEDKLKRVIADLKALSQNSDKEPIESNGHQLINSPDEFFKAIQPLTISEGIIINKNNELVVHLPRAIKALDKMGITISYQSKFRESLYTHARYLSVKATRAFGKKPMLAYHFKQA